MTTPPSGTGRDEPGAAYYDHLRRKPDHVELAAKWNAHADTLDRQAEQYRMAGDPIMAEQLEAAANDARSDADALLFGGPLDTDEREG